MLTRVDVRKVGHRFVREIRLQELAVIVEIDVGRARNRVDEVNLRLREAEFLAHVIGASAASGHERSDGSECRHGADEFHDFTFPLF